MVFEQHEAIVERRMMMIATMPSLQVDKGYIECIELRAIGVCQLTQQTFNDDMQLLVISYPIMLMSG